MLHRSEINCNSHDIHNVRTMHRTAATCREGVLQPGLSVHYAAALLNNIKREQYSNEWTWWAF